ncbi:TetR/AcrR family transcriptional regulator [Streptomyces sp. bgisy031]|uniref:TetR/AcrR family transcriptional regulator n=1 Tax=Streptomyces sp. bgisy031 TaxID=3413772 RepID=UPI003D7653B0
MRTQESGRTPVRRPADRKQRIAAAAAELFRDRGFHNVSVAHVAEAVGITAPAVYRHFRNKQDLLAYVVRQGVRDLENIGASEDLDGLLRAMASRAAGRQGLTILWQREARHLPEEQREELRRYISAVVAGYAAQIRAERPELSENDSELLGWAVLGVFSGVSALRVSVPRSKAEATIHRLAARVADCELGYAHTAPSAAERAGGVSMVMSRREQLLTEAIRLFDERSFQSVSTDDIGEAVGASGPSIYKHFPSKTDLLVAAVVRGGERRQLGTSQALARATTAREALDLLLRAYIDFALEQSHLIGVLISELDQLPESNRKSALQTQRDYLALWEKVLGQAVPDLDAAELKMTVRAVITMVNNVARTGRLAARPDVVDRLVEIGTALLTDD